MRGEATIMDGSWKLHPFRSLLDSTGSQVAAVLVSVLYHGRVLGVKLMNIRESIIVLVL